MMEWWWWWRWWWWWWRWWWWSGRTGSRRVCFMLFRWEIGPHISSYRRRWLPLWVHLLVLPLFMIVKQDKMDDRTWNSHQGFTARDRQRFVTSLVVLLLPTRVVSESALRWRLQLFVSSEKTRKSNHLHMLEQRLYFLLGRGRGWAQRRR